MTNKVYNNVEIAGSVEIAGGGNLGENLQALIVELINKNQYDDRQYYISDDPTSPAAKHGGTWEQIKDVFLLAAGDAYTAGSTGGSANAVLVKHKHTFRGVYAQNNDSFRVETATANPNSFEWVNLQDFMDEAGEDGTGKNMPPYLAVYVWRKIS